MKILIIANYAKSRGGISSVVFNHYNKIKSEGYTVEIFNTKKNWLIRSFLIFPLSKEVKKYDVIHIHGCSFLGFFPIILGLFSCKFLNKKKTIVTFHGGEAKQFLHKYHKSIKRLLAKVDHITVMSEFLKNTFDEYGINTVILPNLINVESKNSAPADFSTPKLVSIRSLNKIYNIDNIIKAYRLLLLKYVDAELKIIGDGPELDTLFKYCLNERLVGVKFLGKIPNELIPDELMKSNIFVSVPSADNQPMSVLEAFACGIPVVSSRVGGIPDMIKEGVNGFLVEVNKPNQIVDKVEWIMKHPTETQNIIENAKNELKKYNWDSIKAQLFNLYKD